METFIHALVSALQPIIAISSWIIHYFGVICIITSGAILAVTRVSEQRWFASIQRIIDRRKGREMKSFLSTQTLRFIRSMINAVLAVLFGLLIIYSQYHASAISNTLVGFFYGLANGAILYAVAGKYLQVLFTVLGIITILLGILTPWNTLTMAFLGVLCTWTLLYMAPIFEEIRQEVLEKDQQGVRS